jgi:hypothetical protein
MIRQVLLFFCIFFSVSVFAQEFNCNVSVSHSKIQGSNQELFDNMRKDLYEFVNVTRWTDNVFSIDERIQCNLFFTLDEQIGADEFSGSLQIQLSRPVFNSSYTTTLLNFQDNDIRFRYAEFESLKYDAGSTNSNLVSLIAFYTNIMLGMTYDTFSPNGGGVYYSKAEAIVSQCQNNIEKGWKSFESRKNRYWIVENIQDAAFSGVRTCYYQYHRNGLDMMDKDVIGARSVVAESLELIRKSYRERSNSMIIKLFFDAKSDEIMNIFSESFNEEKMRVYNVVAEVDPTNLTKYKQLINNK